MGMEVPFPLPQANGCIDSGITCPIVKGISIHFRFYFYNMSIFIFF